MMRRSAALRTNKQTQANKRMRDPTRNTANAKQSPGAQERLETPQ
jgi:hypothetical protein